MTTDLPYRIDLWADDACNRIEERLANSSDIHIARAAYREAVARRPDRMITLSNRALVLQRSKQEVRPAAENVVQLRQPEAFDPATQTDD